MRLPFVLHGQRDAAAHAAHNSAKRRLHAAEEVVIVESSCVIVLIVDLNVKFLFALKEPVDFEEFLPFRVQVVLLRFCDSV